jgi:tetratricopeptide (TPR) repeat protein
MSPATGVERLVAELRSTSGSDAADVAASGAQPSATTVVAPVPIAPMAVASVKQSFWKHRLRAAAVGVVALSSVALLLWSRQPATSTKTDRSLDSASGSANGRVTTTSAVAYRLYSRGLRAYYELDRTAAYQLFHAALAEDSTFAMAAYYAGFSTTDVRERDTLLQRAARFSIHATDRERLVIAEGIAMASMSAKAVALADTMVVRYPLDPDAQFAFGHVLLRRGDFLAAAQQFRRVIAMAAAGPHEDGRCLACDAQSYLTWAYWFGDSVDAAARVTREFSQEHPTIDSFFALEAALARAGRVDEARRAFIAVDSLSHGSTTVRFAPALLSLRQGDFADADARLRRLAREGDAAVRDEAEWDLMISLRTQGRLRETLELATRHRDPITRAIALFENGRPSDAAKDFESLVNVTDTILTGNAAKHRAWMLTHVATSLAAAGDTTRLAQLADSVEWIGQLSMFGRDLRLHHYIRGLLWNARRERQKAVDEFREAIWSWSDGYTRVNLELARALLALDRPADAVYPMQAALRGELQASNLYVTRTELHELLAQAFDKSGNRDSAVVHYREVANAWRRCDPDLRPRLTAARSRLNELLVERKSAE